MVSARCSMPAKTWKRFPGMHHYPGEGHKSNMPNPIDLKVLVKQFLTDPKGLNLPISPSTAIVSGNATGDKGNWTGVYGHSERSMAIYASSPVLAGFFEGEVFINGPFTQEHGDAVFGNNVTIKGDLTVKGQTIQALIERMNDLQRQLNQLSASGTTSFGVPVTAPTQRPSIEVIDLRAFPNTSEFTCTGNNFQKLAHVVFNIFNSTKRTVINAAGDNPSDNLQNRLSNSAILARADGSFDLPVFTQCDAGDVLEIVATDGRSDANDTTGVLWSNKVIRTAF